MNLNATEFASLLQKKIDGFEENWKQFGIITSVKDNILTIIGLNEVSSMEMLKTESGFFAMAFNLEEDCVKAVLLHNVKIKEGEKIFATGNGLKVPVGEFFGRVINPLGEPLDDLGDIKIDDYYDMERSPTDIIERASVKEPLITGIMSVDTLVPIGRGQKEMILGEKKTGKTSIAETIIIQQKNTHNTKKPVYCIYVAIGEKGSSFARTVQKLKEHNALKYTICVFSSAADTVGMQYITPYCAMSMAEYLKEKKNFDVLVIFDSLDKHAISYRSLSLLLRRPPGREAFPGEIFFSHAKLLERSSNDLKFGSITVLPIVESQGGDNASYIVTNIISITDGQLFLSFDLFNSGIKPAINVGLSVSRIGSSAQSKKILQMAKGLKSFLSQYYEIKQFSSFMSDMDTETKNIVKKGDFLCKCAFVQEEHECLQEAEQVILLAVPNVHNFYLLPQKKYYEFKHLLLKFFFHEHHNLLNEIKNVDLLNTAMISEIENIIGHFITGFLGSSL